MTTPTRHQSLRWRRRVLRAYEIALCGVLVGIGVAAAWPG